MSWIGKLFGSGKEAEPLTPAQIIEQLDRKRLILVDGESVDMGINQKLPTFSFHKDLVDPKGGNKAKRNLLQTVRGLLDRYLYYDHLSHISKSPLFKFEDDGSVEFNEGFRRVISPFAYYLWQEAEEKHGPLLESFISPFTDEDDIPIPLVFGKELYAHELIAKLHEMHGKIPEEKTQDINLYKQRAKWALALLPRDILEIILLNEIPFRYKTEKHVMPKHGEGPYQGFFDPSTNSVILCEGGGNEENELKGIPLLIYNHNHNLITLDHTTIHEVGHSIYNWDQGANQYRVLPPGERDELDVAVMELKDRIARIKSADPQIREEFLLFKEKIPNKYDPVYTDIDDLLTNMDVYAKVEGAVLGTEEYENSRKEYYGDKMAEEYLMEWFYLMCIQRDSPEFLEFISPKMCAVVKKFILDKAAEDLKEIKQRLAAGKSPEVEKYELMRDRIRSEITGEAHASRASAAMYENLIQLR